MGGTLYIRFRFQENMFRVRVHGTQATDSVRIETNLCVYVKLPGTTTVQHCIDLWRDGFFKSATVYSAYNSSNISKQCACLCVSSAAAVNSVDNTHHLVVNIQSKNLLRGQGVKFN